MELLLLPRIMELALMARFTSVIEPLPLLATFPVVLSAKVETPLGAIAAVTFMFPP